MDMTNNQSLLCCGRDGLCPQLIRDILMCQETGADFLSTLILRVRTLPVLFGGRILSLNKKTGGIRPIAIGFTLRRLASKCANSFGTGYRLSFNFYHQQLDVSTHDGCEAAVHSARRCSQFSHLWLQLQVSLREEDILLTIPADNDF